LPVDGWSQTGRMQVVTRILKGLASCDPTNVRSAHGSAMAKCSPTGIPQHGEMEFRNQYILNQLTNDQARRFALKMLVECAAWVDRRAANRRPPHSSHSCHFLNSI